MSEYKTDRDLLTWRDNGISGQRRIAVIIHTDESAVLGNHTGSMRATAWSADRLAEYNIEAREDHDRGSYHIGVDRTGRAVRQNNDAYGTWSVGNKGNDICFHICLTGTANQSREQWLSFPEQLNRAAEIVAHYCREYGIQARRVTPSMLQRGESGIGGHYDCTWAWSGGSGHWDPGGYNGQLQNGISRATNGGFPWDHFINIVRSHTAGTPPAPSIGGNDMTQLSGVSAQALDIVRQGVEKLIAPIPSLINPSKRFLPADLIGLVDATTWRTHVLVRELAKKQGLDPDRIIEQAINADRGGK